MGKVLSLFTGAGGLDVGLERAGLHTIACVELDADARSVLAANRPGWVLPGDGDVNTAARQLVPRALGMKPGELELIAGGPPCQPFSKAAQWASTARSGMQDDRAKCVHGMLDLVESFLPKALLIENVEGFLRGKDNASEVIGEGLEGINGRHGTSYRLVAEVVDAAGFGVPQHRRRAIGIAYRDGAEVRLPEATHEDSPIRAWDVLWDLEEKEKPPATGQWAALLPSIPEGGNYLHLTARGEGEELFGWRTRYWSFLLKLAKDRPSWTLPASPGPSTGPFHWDNRPLSVREQMRLQTFPDDWRIDHPFRAGRRMVGNATPPLLAEVLGRTIVGDLELGEASARTRLLGGAPSLLPVRQPRVPRAVAPVPIPEAYQPQVGAKQAHPGEGIGPSPRRLVTRG
ncbi:MULTISPECIES: DNA cytosine methyltransferase [Streptomyces]|uniref:DNA cytosine methyltransferase n=1 Tax=Streptomyces TaxID=1883 RepID=UPI0029A83136|nr:MULTISPECIES: DNA cytosine methyltransferase [unclassified Streptomyces]MDX3185408.1 DNA cytosine methyltransferase [Streptomyces sp. ME02-7008A-1]MDX3305767.1 DNA cytosine methyltransferase [Streptomyces sp. ME02-7008A]